MTGFRHEPRLHGWDDEKVYFVDETGVEWCVSDYPDLLVRLVEICRDYFAQKTAAQSGDEKLWTWAKAS
jgi:hypothetical protein